MRNNYPEQLKIFMQIIIHAGNARVKINDALKSGNARNLEKAHELIKTAEEDLNQAHHIHMKLLQSEAKGDNLEFSILLTHAQDTLMVTMSEVQMAKHMLAMYAKIYECTQ